MQSGDRPSSFAVLRGIDAIIGEWRPQAPGNPRIASGGGERSPIARQHRRSRNEVLYVGRIRPKCRALIRAKEEYFILHDRPADCSSKLISLERTLDLVAGPWIDRSKIFCGIEKVVAQKFE